MVFHLSSNFDKKVFHGQELLRQEGAESDQGSGVGPLHGLRHLAKHDGQGVQSIFLRNTSWGPGRAPPPHENLMTKVHLDDFEKIQLILETPFSNMRDQVKFLQEYGWITWFFKIEI